MTPLQDLCCARLPAGSLPALADLRAEADVRVITGDGPTWVLWEPGNERVLRRVFAVPGAELYGRQDGLWYRFGHHLPAFDVPVHQEARPLHQVLTPAPVEPEWPAPRRAAREVLTVVPDDRPRPARALRCELAALGAWADLAPTARLQALEAAHLDGEVLLTGRPLPPVAGVRFWGGRVLVPLGFRPEPELPESALLEVVGAADAEYVLLTPEGVELVPQTAFHRLRRAAVRLGLREKG